MFLSSSFYLGILEVLQNYEITFSEEKGVSLNEIKKKFGSSENSIYEIFGLNSNVEWLGNEIRNLLEGKDREGLRLIDKLKEENNWNTLSYFLFESNKKDEFRKRNFLAHCGFERTITEVRKSEDGEIFLRWRADKLDKIKKYILEEV